MIYVRLAGGLGNQLFQLACALKMRVNREPIVLATNAIGHYKTARRPEVQRIVALDRLGVQLEHLSSPVLKSVMSLRLPRLLTFFGVGDRSFSPKELGAASGSSRRHLFLDGYFQTQWDWPSLVDPLQTIAQAVSLPSTPQAVGTCAIHVRGTDLLLSENHRLLGPSFYQRAVAKLVETQAISSIKVVTDDLAYARSVIDPLRRMFPSLECHYAPGPTSVVEDFAALRDANLRVIPNSTFSWWASATDSRHGYTIGPSSFVKHAARHPVLPWEESIAPDHVNAPTASHA